MREQKGLSLPNRSQKPGTNNRRPVAPNIYQDSAGYVTELDDTEYDEPWPTKLPSSSRYDMNYTQGNTRYEFHPNRVQSIPPRSSAQPQPAQCKTEDIPLARTRQKHHWMYTQAFRTFSIDKAVGHNQNSDTHPSHFIVQNDNRHTIIIELPANDASKSLVYFGLVLIGDGQDRTPVTISFQLNRQTGRVDMARHVQGQSYVFVNSGKRLFTCHGKICQLLTLLMS